MGSARDRTARPVRGRGSPDLVEPALRLPQRERHFVPVARLALRPAGVRKRGRRVLQPALGPRRARGGHVRRRQTTPRHALSARSPAAFRAVRARPARAVRRHRAQTLGAVRQSPLVLARRRELPRRGRGAGSSRRAAVRDFSAAPLRLPRDRRDENGPRTEHRALARHRHRGPRRVRTHALRHPHLAHDRRRRRRHLRDDRRRARCPGRLLRWLARHRRQSTDRNDALLSRPFS